MTNPTPPEEEAVQNRALEAFARAADRPWSRATETERRLARATAEAELWGEALEARLWARADAEQCFGGD